MLKQMKQIRNIIMAWLLCVVPMASFARKRLRIYTLHNSKKAVTANKCCYCFFHLSGSKSLYFSSGVFGCHSMVFSMTSLMYSNRLMPFNLHEMAIE